MGGCRGAFRAWSHWCGGRRRARRRPEHQRSTPSTARLEDAAGPAGPGRASRRRAERSSRRGRRAGGQAPRRSEIRRAAGPEGARNTSGAHQVPPDGRLPQPRRCEGRRRTGLRCPWVAAGPGRASRRRAERSSRRGRRAGGPPPTGTQSSAANELPLLSADAGFWASRVVDEARHVALEEGGDGRGRARAVLGDDDVGFAGAVFLVVVVGAV